ncbi:hypothetical protein IAQ61_000033 [Plenodomus lingam]|uniref:uncharacterized protein n=1 Tax=Leptosphaeria maculans TaxID=5022 RepID=UPI003316E53F|nr:hypothetical protein IAQ61_000033 [Plenodomus lingam]
MPAFSTNPGGESGEAVSPCVDGEDGGVCNILGTALLEPNRGGAIGAKLGALATVWQADG